MTKNKPLEIPTALVVNYFDFVVGDYLNKHDGELPCVVEEFYDYLPSLRESLMMDCEQVVYAAALKSILQGDGPLQRFCREADTLDDEEVRTYMEYFYHEIKPHKMEDDVHVVFTSKNLRQYRAENGIYYFTEEGDTLRSISAMKGVDVDVIVEENPYMISTKGLDGLIEKGRVVRLKSGDTWY